MYNFADCKQVNLWVVFLVQFLNKSVLMTSFMERIIILI